MRLRPPDNRVSPRAMAQWGLEYLLGWAIATGLAAGAAAWIDASHWSGLPHALVTRVWWVPPLVAALGLVTVVVAPVWRYRVHRWEVSSDVVYTRAGWFNRHWLLVPVSRIQTVDTDQGWVERILGLATIKISTASHEGSSKVAGLTVQVAIRLAADLAGRAHDLRDDAT
ncbi:PH domain-containing protein [Actinomadura alba]|uniref:PH domain-containing protein n=2 Tax=Actinomadura alba TaxID=406431 RepID=A0ABR7LJJ6_9ACTN|nr:PH domain-containing protein [Actinomadura alba]